MADNNAAPRDITLLNTAARSIDDKKFMKYWMTTAICGKEDKPATLIIPDSSKGYKGARDKKL